MYDYDIHVTKAISTFCSRNARHSAARQLGTRHAAAFFHLLTHFQRRGYTGVPLNICAFFLFNRLK